MAHLDEFDAALNPSWRVAQLLEVQLFFGYVVAEYYPHVGPNAALSHETATSTAAE
jgi:hypothetical protein